MTPFRAFLSQLARRLRQGAPETNNWVAMVDQHHRMVRAMVMASPVHPPLPVDMASDQPAAQRSPAA